MKKINHHITSHYAGIDALLFLLHQMRQYRWYSVLLPFMACISQVSLSLILIILPKIVLDAVENNRDFQYLSVKIVSLGIGLLGVTLINMILHNEIQKCSQTFLYRKLTVLWEQKTIHLNYNVFMSNLRKIAMEKARQAICSPNWGIVELLSREAAVLEAGAGLFVYCVIVGEIHPLIILFLVALFGIELLWGLKAEKKKQGFKDERARADRRLNYMAYGTKGMKEAKDIRIYFMSALLKRVTENVIRDKCKVEEKIQKWQFYHMAMTAFLILLRDGIAYVFLIIRYLNADMSIGDFYLYFAAITGIGGWLTSLSNAISGYMETNNYIIDFYQFMQLPDDAEDKEANEEIKIDIEKPISFQLKNISFSYRISSDDGEKSIPVLKKINLNIEAGEKIAIVGVNGAGKSTLIKILCGLLTPDEGRILVNGIDSREFSRKQFFDLFSAVFQKSQILPVSIADNIMLNVFKENKKERMWECLRMAGLVEKIKSLPEKENTCLMKRISGKGTDLSGGQEQRLLLARALYKNAPVLILDEPTAALDPIAENDIYQKYNELTKEKTSFFVSHRLASTRFCDRIIFLEDGEIVESGSHNELMELNGRYADMFRVQSKYYGKERLSYHEGMEVSLT